MNNKLFFLLFATCCMAFTACLKTEKKLHLLVDPFVGTGGHGHTYPGASLPFASVQLSPDTRLEGWDGCSGYHDSDSIIYGFSHTHLSGTGVGDYGDVLLMPGQGKVFFDNGYKSQSPQSYASPFQKKNEKAHAGYYQVTLDKHQIDVRLTATERVGFHEYSFHKTEASHVLLDLKHRDHLLDAAIEPQSKREVVGRRISKAWAEKQQIYFVMQFSQDFSETVADSSGHKMAFIFDSLEGGKLLVKVGLSAVSVEGARKNLEEELSGWDFNQAKAEAEKKWDLALAKVELKKAPEEQSKIFYTALYHSMLAPNIFSDVDGHYRGMDGEIHQSKKDIYTVFSLWDTFRASHPLYSILDSRRNTDFINTLLQQYQDGGELPIWELAANYTGCMIGYHAIPVIVDAYMKGNRDFDADLALEAMLKSARNNKLGLDAYKSKGFIGMADEAESVSKTLEYAYDDWCIAQFAQALGNETVYKEFIQRAQHYKNLFNPELGFMQSKLYGGWTKGFDPAEVNFNFTEANSWQYSLFVPQDIAGLIELYGGEAAFESQLDQLFSTEMELSGREQADITGLIGQYAHGNEPSHHMAYLYNYIGKAYKTQERVDQILREQYHLAPDGLSGNEDCGQMSAWYVLSSLGFYQVTPGTDYYAIGSPLFEEALLNLENGNQFRIKAENRTAKNKYIQSASLNGKILDRAFLHHAEIIQGGDLVFKMGENPNLAWGSEKKWLTSIKQDERIVINPYVKTEGFTFSDSLKIELESPEKEAAIFYKLNEEEFKAYTGPFYLKQTASLSFYAERDSKRSFVLSGLNYQKIKSGRSIELLSQYSNQYLGGGESGLIDYLRGGDDFRTGFWQGYYNTNFAAVVDFGSVEEVKQVSLGALQDIKSWIWFPAEVRFSYSNNGVDFRPLAKVQNQVSDSLYGSLQQDYTFSLKLAKSFRYLKVEADNYGPCPAWHLGAGYPSWLFFDEISIN